MLLQILTTVFPLIFTSNLVMSVVKWFASASVSSTWLRIALAIISIFGVLASSALNGTPVDFNSVSSMAFAVVQAVVIAVGAHFSYLLIKKA